MKQITITMLALLSLVPLTAGAAALFVPYEETAHFSYWDTWATVIARPAQYYDPSHDQPAVEIECNGQAGSTHLLMTSDEAKKHAKSIWDAAWAAETP